MGALSSSRLQKGSPARVMLSVVLIFGIQRLGFVGRAVSRCKGFGGLFLCFWGFNPKP